MKRNMHTYIQKQQLSIDHLEMQTIFIYNSKTTKVDMIIYKVGNKLKPFYLRSLHLTSSQHHLEAIS